MMTKYDFTPGMAVFVEGVVIDYEDGLPYGAVLIEFPAATDESHLRDGVRIWQPQALVEPGYLPLSIYISNEGFYPEDE